MAGVPTYPTVCRRNLPCYLAQAACSRPSLWGVGLGKMELILVNRKGRNRVVVRRFRLLPVSFNFETLVAFCRGTRQF